MSQNRSLGKPGSMILLDKLGVGRDNKTFGVNFGKWDLDVDGSIALCKDVMDDGRPRQVVLKFMKNAEQFQREVDIRRVFNLLPEFVVGVNHFCKLGNDFSRAIEAFNEHGELVDQNHAIVMPLADRSLDTIFRSERPDSTTKIQVFAKDLAQAIATTSVKLLPSPLMTGTTSFWKR